MRVSAAIAFQAQVSYRTLPSVRGLSQSKVVLKSAFECNHRISGTDPLPHTAKGEEDEPVNDERVCV